MSEKDSATYYELGMDAPSFTVILNGHKFVADLLSRCNVETLGCLNLLAKFLVTKYGSEFGVKLDGINDHRWMLGSENPATAELIASFVTVGRSAEVTNLVVGQTKDPKKNLH